MEEELPLTFVFMSLIRNALVKQRAVNDCKAILSFKMLYTTS